MKNSPLEFDATGFVEPHKVDHAKLDALSRELFRLRPKETLAKSNEALEEITPNDLDRICAISGLAMAAGCSLQAEVVISENPKVIGVIFIKEDINPALMDSPPEGSA
jgi:hypothetical protein